MTEFLLGAAGQPWMLVVVLLLCMLDGFFPPIPSEALVVGMAALSLAPGGPNTWLLFAAAALGAFGGDNIAYALGRRLGSSRWRLMQRPSLQLALHRAGTALQGRGIMLILVARFVPVGRVAVSLSAGATGFPKKAFRLVTGFSSVLWAGYSIAIGAVAGRWFQDYPLLGIAAAIVLSAAVGLIADKASKAHHSRQAEKSTLQTPELTTAQRPEYASIDA